MIGIGFVEIVILLGLGLLGLVGLAVLFWGVRAAVRAENRDSE